MGVGRLRGMRRRVSCEGGLGLGLGGGRGKGENVWCTWMFSNVYDLYLISEASYSKLGIADCIFGSDGLLEQPLTSHSVTAHSEVSCF